MGRHESVESVVEIMVSKGEALPGHGFALSGRDHRLIEQQTLARAEHDVSAAPGLLRDV
jgi:hypothetical protein